MKPFSKSVWIFPAACGALVPFCHREEVGEGRGGGRGGGGVDGTEEEGEEEEEEAERTNELFWRRWITACERHGV